MRKLSLSFVTVVALVAAVSASSLFARAQGAARFDYLRLSPGLPGGMEIPPTARVGYQACLATYVEWKCREFESKDSSDGGLRAALTTLGNEGWELVSMIDETQNLSHPKGLTYLFKRAK